MLDIVEVADGKDLGLADSVVMKAGNVVSTQIGSLAYQPDFGVDQEFFLFSDLQIQKESYRAHLVERLSLYQINVNSMIDAFNQLFWKLTMDVSGTAAQPIGESTVAALVPALATEDGDFIQNENNQNIEV